MSTSTPHRYRQSAVDRYWPIIHQVLSNWPNPILVNPHPLSSETFSCRFRDAITAIRTQIAGTPTQYLALQSTPDISVHQRPDGNLLIGDKASLKAKTSTPHLPSPGSLLDAVITPSDLPSDTPTPTQDILHAIFTLLAHNYLSHIEIRNITEVDLLPYIQACPRPLELIQTTPTSITIF